MYFLILLLAYLFIILLGEAMVRVAQISVPQNFRLLTDLLLGILGVSTCYSFMLTGEKTIHIGFLIIGVLAIYIHKKEDRTVYPTPFPIADFLCFGAILITWFIYFYTIFNQYTFGIEGQLSLIAEDVVFYSLLGEQLHATGIETPLGNVSRIDSTFAWLAPYHYFELYFGQFWASCFGIKSLYSHIYISNSISVAMLSYLVWNFAREYSNSRILFLSCLLSPFCSGIWLTSRIPQAGHYMFNLLEMNTFKYSFLFLFFLLAVFLAWNKSRFFLLPILILMLMNYALVPIGLVVLGSFGILTLGYNYYYQKEQKILWAYATATVLLLLFVWQFYAIYGLPNDYKNVQIDIIQLLNRLQSDWQTSLNILVGSFIYIWLDYVPHVILMLLSVGYNYSRIKWKISWSLLLLPLFFLGGAMSYSLLRLITTEAFQPHSIAAAFVGNASIILIILYSI